MRVLSFDRPFPTRCYGTNTGKLEFAVTYPSEEAVYAEAQVIAVVADVVEVSLIAGGQHPVVTGESLTFFEDHYFEFLNNRWQGLVLEGTL